VCAATLDFAAPCRETGLRKADRAEERGDVERTVSGDFEEDHGEAIARESGLVREDFPEFDEALDPEFEPEFDIKVDPENEKRDVHEVDEEVTER
jgi:hypothetical protein